MLHTISVKSRVRAMVLPTIIMLVLVLVLLASVLVSNGTLSLRTAQRDVSVEQAYLAADAGLVRVAALFARGEGLDDKKGVYQETYRGKLANSDWKYEVLAIINPDGSHDKVAPDGTKIPPLTTYLRSESIAPDSEQSVKRAVAGIFTLGAGSFRAGVLADNVVAQDNSMFSSYDSRDNVDPTISKSTTSQAILTGRKQGTAMAPQFKFDPTTKIEGNVYLAPNSDINSPSQIDGKDQVLGIVSNLGKPIDVPDIKVPGVKRGSTGDASDDEFDEWDDGYKVTVVKDPSLNFIWNADKGMWLLRHGSLDYGYYDPNSSDTVMFNSPVRYTSSGGREVHDIKVENGRIYMMDKVDHEWEGSGNLPERSLPATENPSQLGAGAYSKVTVNSGNTTSLEPGGIFVIKDLEVTDGGILELSENSPVTIYVTNSLKVEGQNAIANTTKLPPNLKIYYTGESEIKLAGGSMAYFSLIAPKANLELIGPPVLLDDATAEPPADDEVPEVDPSAVPGDDTDVSGEPSPTTTFYGALVGKSVSVERASFYYDVATGGIGESTDANTFYLIHKFRL